MKKIWFRSKFPGVAYSTPKPASRIVPEWFRKFEGVVNGQETIKKCVPFLDAMTTGYMITLAADIYVDKNGIQQISKHSVVTHHPEEQIGEMKIPYVHTPT